MRHIGDDRLRRGTVLAGDDRLRRGIGLVGSREDQMLGHDSCEQRAGFTKREIRVARAESGFHQERKSETIRAKVARL